ncbi:MAG: hypothetical protein ACFCUS_02225 [Rubrimonas sp.]|uniref:hypothetical protein n=1 Tax=Rubrimonas sp. TaxID=2036015 RepID=UPI002FDD06BA
MRHPAPRPPLFTRILFAIPVFGRILREINEGRDGAFVWFAASLAGLVGVLALGFGLAGLVAGMLFMTLVMFLLIATIAKG